MVTWHFSIALIDIHFNLVNKHNNSYITLQVLNMRFLSLQSALCSVGYCFVISKTDLLFLIEGVIKRNDVYIKRRIADLQATK